MTSTSNQMKSRELNGYIVVYQPEHPSAMKSKNWEGYIYEHILEAEKMIGRPLRSDECVHHLNGVKNDNRWINLLVLMKGQHNKLHGWLKRCGININEATPFKKCVVCEKTIENSRKFCSVDCYRTHKARNIPDISEIKDMLNSGMSMVAVGKHYNVSDNAVRKWLARQKEETQ